MTWAQLSSIISALSGFAVLISLVFVFLQLRVAVKNQQAMIRTFRANRLVELNMAAADPSFADAWFKGMGGAEDLSSTQFAQFLHVCRATFANSEDAFYQYREGLLNKAAFDSFSATVRFSFFSLGYRVAWRSSRELYGREFIDFMDKNLNEVAIKPTGDRLAQWNADLAAEQSNS
ncbi:MAG TPA: hypothetical protein VGI30_02030, partial [Caulobacteraceae bacterium]